MYIGDYWQELWNTKSKGWQVAQRVGTIGIFVSLVVFALKYGAGSPQMGVATVLVPLVASGAVAVLFFLVFVPYRLWLSAKAAVEFYVSRSAFNKSRGSLLEVIRPCHEVWLTMWTGSKTWQDEVFKQGRVKKLIIQHPDFCLVKTFADTEKGDFETYRRNIVSTTSRALENSVPVVWANEAIVGLIIANANEAYRTGWARMEYFIPHSTTPEPYPSFVVRAASEAEADLYRRLVKSYDDMFNSPINVRVTEEILQKWRLELGM